MRLRTKLIIIIPAVIIGLPLLGVTAYLSPWMGGYPDCWSSFKIYYDDPSNFDETEVNKALNKKYDNETMKWIEVKAPDENGLSYLGIPVVIDSDSPEREELYKILGEINHVVKVEGGRVACV